MVNFVIGGSGSGKTEFLLRQLSAYSSKHDTYGQDANFVIIVPEQQALDTERLLSSRLGDGYNMFCEVLNFERLCDRVFREYGGVAKKYLDGGRGILMSSALEKLSGRLRQYKGISGGADYVRKMLSAVTQFAQASMSADDVSKLAEEPGIKENEPVLSEKLADLSHIIRTYKELCADIDDPVERPNHLAEMLKIHPFFKGKTLIVDSYYTFTEQEYEILRLAIDQCEDCYISFCMPESAVSAVGTHFDGIASAYRRIKRYAAASGKKANEIFISGNRRAARNELAFLAENIWNPIAKPYNETTTEDELRRAINIYECEGVFGEVAAAASEVRTLVRDKGLRYRDIGVAMRNTESYSAVIEAVFAKYGIPVFLSVREDITSKPLLSLIFAAVDCAKTDFSSQSVKQFIKSSFSALTREESDYLSSYIDIWKIRGRSRYKGVDWQMNPDGYRDNLSPRAEKVLAVVASAKQKLCETLVVFAEEIGSGLSAEGCARAIYSLLEATGAEERLTVVMRTAREDGDEERVSELSQLWDIVISMLDQLCLTGGEEKLSPKRLLELLRILAAEYSTGRLPGASDAVTVADARLARFDNIKALLLLGVNEGIFPSADRGGELFADSELKVLEKAGYQAFLPPEKRLAEEQFLFYTSVCAPSERLSVYYSSSSSSGGVMKASAAVGRISALFPTIGVIRPAADKSRLIQNGETAGDFLSRLPDEVKMFVPFLPVGGITEFDAKVEAGMLDDIVLSPSSIEKYSLCPFSFFVKYVLRLQTERTAAFESGEVGTFIHKLLEVYLKKYADDFEKADKKKIAEELRDIASEFVELISNGSEGAQNKRLEFSIGRITGLTKLFVENILDEFAQSSFRPIGFEVKLGRDGAPQGKIPLSDGRIMVINGIADRVDSAVIDGKEYIRVVDYKSGTQKYNPVEPVYGIALQMFLYLASWCEGGKAEPAGVLYMPVKPPELKDDSDGKIKRSGLILEDSAVIEAMESQPSDKYIPVKYNSKPKKDGTPDISKNSSVATRDEFNQFFSFMKGKLTELDGGIRSGDVSVNPLLLNKNLDACKRCDFLPVCRNGRNKKRRVENLKTDKAKEILFGREETAEKED